MWDNPSIFQTITGYEMTNLLITDAWAQAGGGSSSMFSFLPLVLIFVLFYFLLIRPQQRKKKEHQGMVAAMKVGDEVATNDGLLGKVTGLDDNFVRMEVAQGVNVKSVIVQVQRHAIAQMIPKGTYQESDGGGKKSKDSSKRSKDSGRKSKASANNLSGQIPNTQSDNATEDATFENHYTEDATLELKALETAKKEIEEKIKKVSVSEDVDAIVQGDDEPSNQIADPQSNNVADGDQSKKFTINGVEWKQWIRNLLLPFK
jgi:preprotein translocase subunit YajC